MITDGRGGTAGVIRPRQAREAKDASGRLIARQTTYDTRIAHSRSASLFQPISSGSLLIAPDVFQHCEVVNTAAQKQPRRTLAHSRTLTARFGC